MSSVHDAVVPRRFRLLTSIAVAAFGFALVAVLASCGSVGSGGGRAAAGSAPPRAVSSQPVTLVSAKGPIEAFGQDGGWIVWEDTSAPCQQRVKIRRASGGPVRSLVSKQGLTCKKNRQEGYYQGSMAVAGTRALWAVQTGGGNTDEAFSVRTSSLARPVDREVIHPIVFRLEDASGGFLSAPPIPYAGDGPTLVGIDTAEQEGSETFGPSGSYPAFRVEADGRSTAIPNTAHNSAVSASGASLALASAPDVEIRNAHTGALRLRLVPPTHEPVALALTPTFLAVLVGYHSSGEQLQPTRILVYGLDGKLRRTAGVPRSTAGELDAAGRWVVYHTGKTIRGLDLNSGRTRILTMAKTWPIGLSLEGRRLAWAEQLTKQSRIRALTLPR